MKNPPLPFTSLGSIVPYILLCLALHVLPASLHAQRTYSLGLGVGTIYYYGDLTDVFASSQMKPAYSLSFQNYLSPYSSFRFGISYGEIAATDAYANDQPRRTRNLHFKSPLIEAQAVLMYEFIRDRNFGIEYIMRPHISPYIFGGMAGIWFEPQARSGQEWIPLRPLGTEGQYLEGGSGPYSRLQIAFPGGLGVNLRLGSYMGMNVELGYRITLTDYLDDISTVYPDLELLASQNPLAAELSQRSIEPSPNFVSGSIRGNPDANDGYFFFMATITYYFDRFASRGN